MFIFISPTYFSLLPIFFLFLFPHTVTPPENKKCGNRSYRTKSANPDCRQTNFTRYEQYLQTVYTHNGICIFTKIQIVYTIRAYTAVYL